MIIQLRHQPLLVPPEQVLIVINLVASYPRDFEITINMEMLVDTSYQKFITELCNKLVEGDSQSSGVPILPNCSANPHLFNVLLITDNYRATIYAQRDNFYMWSYLIHKSNKWMEFKDDQ